MHSHFCLQKPKTRPSVHLEMPLVTRQHQIFSSIEGKQLTMSSASVPNFASTSPCIISTFLLFGTLLFTYASLTAKCWLSGDFRAVHFTTLKEDKATPFNIESFFSIFTLLHHGTVLGLILLFAYICEYHPP